MKIRAADTTVCDLHLDVGLLEGLGLVVAPFHVTLRGRGVVSDPTLEELSRCGGHDVVLCRSGNVL